ncbi:hypothetical protein EZS27_024374 [termite gut metagenome]|uniref:GmrSD restriction endonucleases N-terminal domain-containing protein n=1 Tax=termite gut metagenome TaxID=433724 RepID=A0A5J4QZJ0_9ZZZZ
MKEYPESIDGVEEESEEFRPYDTGKISIDTKKITMEGCLRRLEQGTIMLAPDFQRNEVWGEDKKSRLIESLMLKIPIPMFYVSADEKGVYSVVDGLQRLSTIRDFVLGRDYLKMRDPAKKGAGLKLQQLEFWGDEYNKYNFNMLPIDMQNRILETEFTFTVINPGTPEEVKRNIFKRINTGGEPLTAQEIRNALYIGLATTFLHSLSKSDEFLESTGESIKTERMMDKELILRSLAFMVRNWNTYSKDNDMDRFLSDTMRIINIMPDFASKESLKFFKDESSKKEGVKREDIQINHTEELRVLFLNGTSRAKQLFGDHTYRKSYGDRRRTPINKALFEVWTVLLSKLSNDNFQMLCTNKCRFLSEYNEYLNDTHFNYFISRDSWKYNAVKERHEQLSQLVKKYI